MDYYRRILRPFLRDICKDHIDLFGISSSISLSSISDAELNKYLKLYMDYAENYFADIDPMNIVDQMRVVLSTNADFDKIELSDRVIAAFHEVYNDKMQALLVEEYDLVHKEVTDIYVSNLGDIDEKI